MANPNQTLMARARHTARRHRSHWRGDYRDMTLFVTVALGLAPALVVLDSLGVDAVAARLAIGGCVTLLAGRLLSWMLIPPPADNRRIYGPERHEPDAAKAV